MEREQTQYDVLIIGAGASGLIAGGAAARTGARTLVLEKMQQPGRKLGLTGKGRCNLTNASLSQSFLQRFGSGGRFLRPAFRKFSEKDLISHLEKLGVPTVVERGYRVFPASQKAGDVARALKRWVLHSGAEMETNAPVRRIHTRQGRISGAQVLDGRILSAKTVILATGGASYPATGSSGDGYSLARDLGHEVTPVRPGLVPLETAESIASDLQGLSLRNAGVSLWIDGKRRKRQLGELMFTHFGLSGPVILSLSSHVVDSLREGSKAEIGIDLKPALDENKLENRLLRELDSRGKQKMHNLMRALLPGKLVGVCLERTGIPPEKTGNQISARERKRLRSWMKEIPFTVTGYRDFDEAIVTQGGVDLSQVDPRSMASRLVPGLYFAGEVLDIDADTGGYNLQAAFSTGWLAGDSAGREAGD